MSQTVIGIFNSAADAQTAVNQLLNRGFSNEDVDLKSNTSTDSVTGTSSANTNEGGVSKFFKNLFSNDDESMRYTTAAQKGSVVSVHVQSDEEAQRASMLLDQFGAVDVDGDDTAGSSYNTLAKNTENGGKISVIEETMQVGKREVKTGGVRLKSRIVEKPVEQSLRLREERVSVQRNKVDRVASDADFNNFQEGTIEMTEHAEVPVVAKEARVVEEISLGKEVNERKETVRDTVRKTEVDVENIEGTKKTTSKNFKPGKS